MFGHGTVPAYQRLRALGHRVITARLERIGLAHGVRFDAVLRGTAGIHQQLIVDLSGRLQQVPGAHHVGQDDAVGISFMRIGAVNREVINDARPDGTYDVAQALGIPQVTGMKVQLFLNSGDPPAIRFRPRQHVHFATEFRQPPGEA